MKKITALTGLISMIGCIMPALRAEEAPKPNIIFILCDDLGPGDIGVLWQNDRGNLPSFETPNLDQFAHEGMILSRHYSPAPVCAPSRASLLTGQHQGNCDIRDNQFDKELPDTLTLASVLKEAGYVTSIFGKWGLQGESGFPGHPLNRGFDFFFGYISHEDGHHHYPKETGVPFYEGLTDISSQMDNCYSTDVLTARAKKWIIDEQDANPTKPFFIYLAYTAPHAGLRIPTNSDLTAETNYPAGGGLTGGVQWTGTPGHLINTASGKWDSGYHPDYANATYNGSAWPDTAKRYATMVRRLDDAVEDVLVLLKDLQIDDNTLIIFTSDNGTHNATGIDNVGANQPNFFDSFGPYDGIKRDMWEGGIRMPTLVRWPATGGVIPDSTSNQPSQFHDWMATFCELAGVAVPARTDGVSLVPTLTGSGVQKESTVYSEYEVYGSTPNYSEFESAHRNKVHGQMQAVYIGDYKGVRVNLSSNSSTFLVYNVATDPKETTNLAGQPGVPSQNDFANRALQLRRISSDAPRPYDSARISAATPVNVSPGIQFKAFSQSYPWVPVLANAVTADKGIAGNIDLSVRNSDSQVALYFNGFIFVPTAGDYSFQATTTSRFVSRIHDALLMEWDSNSSGTANSGTVRLEAGFHPITFTFTQDAAPYDFELRWTGPGISNDLIPDSAFYHISDSAIPAPDFLWLPFDEDSGTWLKDISTRTVGSLQYFEGTSPWITGKYANAVDFDGIDDLGVIVPSSYYPPAGSESRTITAWLKPFPVQYELGTWLNYGTASPGERFTLRVDPDANTHFLVLRCEIQGAFITGSKRLDDGAFHFVAVVLDDLNNDNSLTLGEVRLYVDGELDTVTTSTAVINTGTELPLSIGGASHSPDYNYTGSIDDLRIYPRAFSAGEIAQLAARNVKQDAWFYQQTGMDLPSAQDWASDTDKDGVPAFLEYAFDGSSNGNDRAKLPQMTALNKPEPSLNFKRRKNAGLSYQAYVSTTLAAESWLLATGTYSITTDPDNAEWENVIFEPDFSSLPETPHFYRIEVINNP